MSRAIWPTNRIIGVESWRATCSPAAALVAPGPRVTKQMPGAPVALPAASAIMAADRHGDRSVVHGVERRDVALARNAKDVAHAVQHELVDQHLGGGSGAVIGAHGISLVSVGATADERATAAPSFGFARHGQ